MPRGSKKHLTTATSRPVPKPIAPPPRVWTTEGLVADLASDDDERVIAALADAKKHLASLPDADREAARSSVADRARALLDRKSARVREGVGELADALPDPAAEAVLAALASDVDHYVRRAADRAAGRRRAVRTAAARDDEEERVIGEVLARLEARSGKAARTLAERAVRLSRDAFVKKLGHEITKVLMPIDVALRVLEREAQRPAIERAAIDKEVANARGRLEFCRAILAAAAAVSGDIPVTLAEERLASLVDEARAQLLDRLGPRASRVAFTNDVDPGLRAEVDRHALLQAFQNVLQNAAEAYPDGASDLGPITITVTSSLERRGAAVALSFTDEGKGMNDDELARAFVPFGSKKQGGTGVGLLVARRMVEEAHGGSLTLTTAPGRGTTVTLTLPLDERPPARKA